MTILYEVTAKVDASMLDAFERYMVDHHVPDLLATGCFTGARVCRDAESRLRMSYEAPDQASLHRYLEHHAPGLRADVIARFPTGVTLSRDQWSVIREWRE